MTTSAYSRRPHARARTARRAVAVASPPTALSGYVLETSDDDRPLNAMPPVSSTVLPGQGRPLCRSPGVTMASQP